MSSVNLIVVIPSAARVLATKCFTDHSVTQTPWEMTMSISIYRFIVGVWTIKWQYMSAKMLVDFIYVT